MISEQITCNYNSSQCKWNATEKSCIDIVNMGITTIGTNCIWDMDNSKCKAKTDKDNHGACTFICGGGRRWNERETCTAITSYEHCNKAYLIPEGDSNYLKCEWVQTENSFRFEGKCIDGPECDE